MCGPMFTSEIKLTIEITKDTIFEAVTGDTIMTRVLQKGTVIDVVEDEYGLGFNEKGVYWCRLSPYSVYDYIKETLDRNEENKNVYKEEITALKKFYDANFDRDEYLIDDKDPKAMEFDAIMCELSSWYKVV